MRITKQQLQQIINEEISDVLMRMKNRKLIEISNQHLGHLDPLAKPSSKTMGRAAAKDPSTSGNRVNDSLEDKSKYPDPTKPKSVEGVINIQMSEEQNRRFRAALAARNAKLAQEILEEKPPAKALK